MLLGVSEAYDPGCGLRLVGLLAAALLGCAVELLLTAHSVDTRLGSRVIGSTIPDLDSQRFEPKLLSCSFRSGLPSVTVHDANG